MSHHTVLPLFVDVSDRRCRRLYLAISHLLVPLAISLTSIPLVWSALVLVGVCVSGAYWWFMESSGPHPQVLKWNETLGWRLALPDEDLLVSSIRRLQTPLCLLLEVQTVRGMELLFLRNRAGMNRLRYLLRRRA